LEGFAIRGENADAYMCRHHKHLNGHAAHAQSLQEQGMCAAQAGLTFQEDSNKWDLEQKKMNLGMQTLSFDYQSHYNNTKLKRCLILTTRTYMFGGQSSTSINLYDTRATSGVRGSYRLARVCRRIFRR
jgi:hypothetical protein